MNTPFLHSGLIDVEGIGRCAESTTLAGVAELDGRQMLELAINLDRVIEHHPPDALRLPR